MERMIHLLYVPTMACNMACRYCYLGDTARDSGSEKGALETLRFAVEKFRQAQAIPFNISLHGGEVTTLPREDFRELVSFIADYYKENEAMLREKGFPLGRPHIKTNLYGLDRHLDAIRDFGVSVSGSLDLPLSLHSRYRVSRGGKDTLPKILENLRLLENLPNHKKVSATIFREHYLRKDEIIRDIRWLADNTCLDMNDFNFMIGFASDQSMWEEKLTPLTEAEQVDFFRAMNEAFTGTDLQPGLDNAWFAEFTQAYCTNCDCCGEKFYLLERNGDVYSCVRGQGNPDYYYGNIYQDSAEAILAGGYVQSLRAHQRAGFDADCAACGYLHLCKTGCPFVKDQYGSPKSYTCLLQQEIYRKNGEAPSPEWYPYTYLCRVHPQRAAEFFPRLAGEDGVPSLWDLIGKDPKLQQVYAPDVFQLEVDGEIYPMESQLTKPIRQTLFLTPESRILLHFQGEVLDWLTDYPVNNALYLMLLSSNQVVYGDEQRSKQEHVMTHLVYRSTALRTPGPRPGWFTLDLTKLLSLYLPELEQYGAANLFITTAALRDYHYTKQKENGFYHYHAMNLPFQNMELYWMNPEEDIK